MKKRKYPMNEITITQGRYGSYSHAKYNAYDLVSNNGYFYAPCDMEVIAIFPYSSTGFGNTIHFYDAENSITTALTHMNFISPTVKVGRVYHKGEIMYQIGTCGKATGAHIHAEFSKGRVKSKTKMSYGWALNPDGWINIEDYFYVEKDQTIKNDRGYRFEVKEDAPMGYLKTSYNGQDIHLYRSNTNERLGVISAGKGSYDRKTIDKIDDDRIHHCKLNAGYFNLQNGEHYGVEISPTMENVPHNDYYLVVYEKDGEVRWNYSNNFWYNSNDVSWAMSPFAVLYQNGDCTAVSKAYSNKLGIANTQSFLIGLKDGYVLGACSGKLTPEQCLEFAKKTYGSNMYHFSLYDSGGSTQMIVNGQKIVYTGRAIANCLTIYINKEEGSELKTIHVEKVGLNLRDSIRGKILEFVKKGESATFDKLEPVPKLQADGYQWFKGVKNGKIYFMQYDSSCYWIE